MIGDTAIGHTDAHNELRDGILREASRFGVEVKIGGPFEVGSPGHITEHNKLVTALDLVAKTAGVVVDLPGEHHLGDTGHIVDHDKLAAALHEITISDAWNDASGGIITDVAIGAKAYRVHTFRATDTLTITRSVRPFRVLAVAGGGGGGHGWAYYAHGGQGGNGQAIEKSLTLAVGSYPVTVGGADQPTKIDTITAEQGGHGGDGYDGGGTATDGAPGARHGYITSDITGTSIQYSAGDGAGGAAGEPGQPGLFPGGGGGGGGGATNDLRPSREGGAGGAGAVYVSYEIAPYNVATGGDEVKEYTENGKKYRAHTFLKAAPLVVTIGVRPFEILLVGGGGGGGGWDGNWHGNGGSGGYGKELSTTLTAGSYPAVVGNGGGAPSEGTWNDGIPGGVSSIAGLTADGGPGGDGPGKNGGNYNSGNANGITSTYRNGQPFAYGGGGGENNAGYAGPPNTGHGGGGGHTGRGTGGPGADGGPGGSGIVVIRYEIGNA